jgi:hypothetical protein
MRKSAHISIVCLLALGALADESEPQNNPDRQVQVATTPPEIKSISLIPILANPAKFDGKQVQVEAYVSSESDRFFLAADLLSLLNSRGASLVNLDISACVHKERLKEFGYPVICYLLGTVDSHDSGPIERSPMACTFRASQCKMVFQIHSDTGEPVGRRLQPPPAEFTREKMISLIAVLADPEGFHGREIKLEAFFSYDHGQYFLAPDLLSLANSVAPNLLTLDITSSLHKDRFQEHGNPAVAHLRGTVDAHDFGPLEHSPTACTFRVSDCMQVFPIRREK